MGIGKCTGINHMSLYSTGVFILELESSNERWQRKHSTDEGQVISKNDRSAGCSKDHPKELPVKRLRWSGIVFGIECEPHRSGLGRGSMEVEWKRVAMSDERAVL